jgi:uncharacterized integral membrane protein
MKILSRAVFVLFVVIGMLVAVSNSQPVEVALWPLPQVAVMPLYLLIVGMLLAGILAGLGIGWWSGRHHRKRARERGSEAARLEREVVRLREAVSANRPPAPGSPAAREQKSIDRQSALVAPELLPPTARSPSP